MAQAAPGNLYIMEAANLICGDAGDQNAPGNSTHLSLMELKLPSLEDNFVDVYPGGAPVGIEVPLYTNRLESTFTLAGWQPDIMKMIGAPYALYTHFTAYGLIRERRTGQALQAMAVMNGVIGRMNPTAYRKGDAMQHEYAIRAITHYELYMAATKSQQVPSPDTEIWYWDFFTSQRRTGGVEMNADLIRLLHIPGVAGGAGGGFAQGLEEV